MPACRLDNGTRILRPYGPWETCFGRSAASVGRASLPPTGHPRERGADGPGGPRGPDQDIKVMIA